MTLDTTIHLSELGVLVTFAWGLFKNGIGLRDSVRDLAAAVKDLADDRRDHEQRIRELEEERRDCPNTKRRKRR